MNTEGALTLHSDTDGATATLAAIGEIDLGTAPRFREAALGALADVRTLHLDLSGVSFMDSSGLHVLLATKERADLLGAELVLTRVPRPVGRLLDISGLSTEFARDEGDGVAAPG